MPLIPGGYILQPRKIDESAIMHEAPIVREVWLYILRKVHHRDTKQFKRGQGFFHFGDIQEDLHWTIGYRKMKYSKPQLTKVLRRLCERNMTATTKATGGLIITVLKYDHYQDPKNYEGNDEEIAKETRRQREGNANPPESYSTNDPYVPKNGRMEECKERDINPPIPPLPEKPKSKSKAKSFIPPTEAKVIEFFQLKGFSVSAAKKAWSYYEAGDWKDAKGNQVRNWKQKMIAVWFRDENKARPQTGPNSIPLDFPSSGNRNFDATTRGAIEFLNERMPKDDA